LIAFSGLVALLAKAKQSYGIASLFVVLCLLTSAATAHAECAWVLWKYQDMSYSFPHAPIEAMDAFETRAACIKAINEFEVRYKAQRWHRIHRLNETVLFMASGPLGENREEIQVTCRPDTVDPRGAKGEPR